MKKLIVLLPILLCLGFLGCNEDTPVFPESETSTQILPMGYNKGAAVDTLKFNITSKAIGGNSRLWYVGLSIEDPTGNAKDIQWGVEYNDQVLTYMGWSESIASYTEEQECEDFEIHLNPLTGYCGDVKTIHALVNDGDPFSDERLDTGGRYAEMFFISPDSQDEEILALIASFIQPYCDGSVLAQCPTRVLNCGGGDLHFGTIRTDSYTGRVVLNNFQKDCDYLIEEWDDSPCLSQ